MVGRQMTNLDQRRPLVDQNRGWSLWGAVAVMAVAAAVLRLLWVYLTPNNSWLIVATLAAVLIVVTAWIRYRIRPGTDTSESR